MSDTSDSKTTPVRTAISKVFPSSTSAVEKARNVFRPSKGLATETQFDRSVRDGRENDTGLPMRTKAYKAAVQSSRRF